MRRSRISVGSSRGHKMLTAEENELLSRVGPGTPCGELFRRYWQPVALSSEAAPGLAPLPLRILGEDLVLFRDEQGRPGLLGLHCSHRGADLSYGRLEDGGLRCIYHGWLYDREGRCLEQPGEPAGQAGLASGWGNPSDDPLLGAGPARHEKIRHPAYPCQEAAGAIFAYLGPGDPPLFPNYELFRVPEDHLWLHKYYHECSYLQGNEGNIDPTHGFFLHSYLPGSRLRLGRAPMSMGVRPVMRAEPTDYGARITAFYPDGTEWTEVHTSHFVLPNSCAVAGGPSLAADGHMMNWHVPIDDTHHWRMSMAFRRSGPADPAGVRDREYEDLTTPEGPRRVPVTTPDFRFVRNLGNRYLQDRDELRSETYAGMGAISATQDSCVTETAGAIPDRTQEHLGASDAGIVVERSVLLRAIRDLQEGRDPPHVVRDPEENHFDHVTPGRERILASTSWDEYRQQRDAQLEGAQRRTPIMPTT